MKQELIEAIQTAAEELYETAVTVELTRPEEQFGDYATNVALQLAKPVGKPPREIAETLAVKIRENLAGTVSDISVAGPGFLNFTLSAAALVKTVKTDPVKTLTGKVILAEYSDPNPFKPLHAGHLYTTLVGDVMARLLEMGGADVKRLNYGGDVGLHVGKSMWAIIRKLGGELPDGLNEIPEDERTTWLGVRYVEGNDAYETDEAAKQEIIATNKRVYELHNKNDHDSPFAQIYWTCREWSYHYFEQLYDELEVHQFDRIIPESEVTPLGLETVRAHVGDVYEESQGAIVFNGEKYGLHTRVFINSEGLPTYEAKDVGLMLTKWRDYHYDLSYYVTAQEQAQYMEVMFKSVEQFEPEAAQRARHLTHGTVKLQGGIKMSSRKGNVVMALDILEAARIANRQATGSDDRSTVLGAVKYAFLKNRVGGDIMYDPAESVSLEGNSGPYLQYAHARAKSILAKTDKEIPALDGVTDLETGERSLVRKLAEYAEVIDRAVTELMPHHVATYLYELAQVFNRFYEHNRVVGDEREQLRLALVEQYVQTLAKGLNLLGIEAPDRM